MSLSEPLKFKRSQFVFYGTYVTLFWLIFGALILWGWYQDQSSVSIWPAIATLVFFIIFFFAFGSQQYYFILTEKELVVKNHWLIWKNDRFLWSQIREASYLHSRESSSSKGIPFEAGLRLRTEERGYDYRSGPLNRKEIEALVYEVNLRLLPKYRVIIHPHPHQQEAVDPATNKIIEKASVYSYQPSGRHAKSVFRSFFIFNLLATPILSYLLILALEISYPFFVGVIFLAFPFLFGAFLSVSVISNGMVRNATLAIWLGLASGTCSLYFQYCFWNGSHQHLKFSQQIVHALQPNQIVEDTKRNFAEADQKWNWLVPWGLQIVYLSGFLLFAMPIQTRRPFSEVQQKWYQEMEIPPLSYIKDVAQFMNELIASTYVPLTHVEHASKKKAHCLCTLYYLENERCYLSVTNRRLQDEEGYKSSPKFDSTTILRFFPISQEMGSSFKSLTTKQEKPELKKG